MTLKNPFAFTKRRLLRKHFRQRVSIENLTKKKKKKNGKKTSRFKLFGWLDHRFRNCGRQWTLKTKTKIITQKTEVLFGFGLL